MLKKYVLSVVVVFLLWAGLDYVIHNVILLQAYQATAALWRPITEMKPVLMLLSTLAVSVVFVGIYVMLVNPKSVKTGLIYGVLLGIFEGVPMAIGTYSYMPITMQIAVVWFIGAVVEMTLAGLCIGAIIKEKK